MAEEAGSRAVPAPAGDGGGGDRPPGRGPDGTGRGRDRGWRGPLPGRSSPPAPTSISSASTGTPSQWQRRARHSRPSGSGSASCRAASKASRTSSATPTSLGKRGNRGDLVRPGRQQPPARSPRAGVLVLGRRRTARHADGQRADADRRDGRQRVLGVRPRRAHRAQRRGALRAPDRGRDRRRPPAAHDRRAGRGDQARHPRAARRRGGHPARRTFQAIRMEVNRELPNLDGRPRRVGAPAQARGPHRSCSRTTRSRTAS